ncbi:uncharacterized protein LOC144486168 [Mustelus asterias]
MSRGAHKLVHNAATTLGFATLLPGIVMLLWFYSAASGVTRHLYTIAVALSVAGAAFLLIAITMRLAQSQQRAGPPPEPAAGGHSNANGQPPAAREEVRRVTELHPIPSYRTVVADTPGEIWTIPRMPLSVGGLSVPQLTPPPLYESVFDGSHNKDSLTLPPRGSRRIESEGDMAARYGGPDPRPHFSIEPLTPPPVYELGGAGVIFTFEVRGDPQ